MKYSTFLSVLSVAVAGTDYWYRLCSKDTLKNNAVRAACPQTDDKQSACLLKSDLYQRSLYACFKECESRANRSNSHAFDYSWEYMATSLEGEPSLSIDELEMMDQESPITQSYENANSTSNGAFLPRPQYLSDATIASQSEFTYQRELSQWMARIPCYYVFGIIGLQTIFHALTWLAPSLVEIISNNPASRYIRRYAVLPALFNKHRSTPIKVARYIQLCFPPRLHVLMLAGYVLLCIVGLAYHYPVTLSPAVSPTRESYIAFNLAWRASAMVIYKLPLLFLFAGRNNFMIWLTGWQMEIFNHWHRWIGRLATIDVIIHGIGFCINDAGPTFHDYRSSLSWWRVGVAAAFIMMIMIVQATKTFRAPAYETFLLVHNTLAIAFVICVYYHVRTRAFGLYEMYAVIAVWAFDRFLRLVRIVLGGLNNKATLRAVSNDLLEITVKYSGWWKPQPGAYVFLHFANKLGFLQSHPLSVVPVDSKTVKFVARAQKGMTRVMLDRTVAADGSLECRIWLDGPYGIHFSTHKFKELVTIAGGIGFTSVYSHTLEMLKQNQGQIVHMHWAISSRDPLRAFATELENLQSFSNLKLTVYVPSGSASPNPSEKKSESSSETSGLEIVGVNFTPNFGNIVGDHIRNTTGAICFFSCGPPRMADAIRDAVATGLLNSKYYVQFYEESFTM